MTLYLEIIKKRFLQRFAYRINSLIQILSTIFRLFIEISIWTALYIGHVSIKGINLSDMLSYVIIAQLVRSLTQTNIGERIAEKVVDGSISVDFIRPINFKFYNFSEELGENLYRFTFNTFPACLLLGLLIGLRVPQHPLFLLLFLLSLVLGIVLFYHIDYIFGLCSFWIKRATWTDRVSAALFELFSGTRVPLVVLPGSPIAGGGISALSAC